MSKWICLPRYGEFEIIHGRDGKPRILGEGSFGKTFEAFREDSVAGGMIREYAALKVLNPALLGSETKRFQFLQELTALTKLKHANLIHYIRCGEEQGQVYYAMELCRGGDLTHLVNRFGPLSERTAALIGLQIATGLKEVHRQRLIHRDIKPSNIMLVDEIPEGTSLAELDSRLSEQESLCRIVDFGLVDFAMTRDGDSQASLPRQRFVGSPMFASPEQICELPVAVTSDLYSLGMTLWYLVLGRGPLTDASGRVMHHEREVLRMHVDPAEYGPRLPSHLSLEFREILATLVAKKPEQRYPSAIEVQQSLRAFLDQVTPVASTLSSFRVDTTNQQIDEWFRFHGNPLLPRLGLRRYRVENRQNGQFGCLYVVQDKESFPDPRAHRDHLLQLQRFGELSRQSHCPASILKIQQVVDSSDALCVIEEESPPISLADVLRVRGRSRPLSFREAANLLDPLSSALDYLLQQGQQKVLIPCEEIFLSGDETSASPSQNSALLSKSLSEWQNFRMAFSMLWLETNADDEHFDPTSTMSWSTQTMSGAMQRSDFSHHPVQSFCRLVYRMMSGSEVAAAAEYSPHAYLPVVELSAASNHLLRDILCGQLNYHEVGEVFGQLCMHEALPRTNLSASRNRQSTRSSSTVSGSGIGRHTSASSEMGSGYGSNPATGYSSGHQSPLAGWSGNQSSTHPASSHASAYRTSAGSRSYESGSYGSSGSATGSVDYRRDLPVAEIVSPGVVISPFDDERRPIHLNAEQWKEYAPVICPYAQRPFRLPSRLDPLQAVVIEPGVVASPFDLNGQSIRVEWQDWQPGKKLICRVSGKPFVLPYDIPWPEGIIPANTTQQAISPYDHSALLTDIPLRDWKPGGEVHCPTTGFPFLLPLDLPPPQAIIAPNRPGEIASPYAPAIRWTIEPVDWTPGSRHLCRATQQPFVLTEDILRWPAPTVSLINADERLVSSPFAPGKTFVVEASLWRPGLRVECPFSKRKVSLPPDLPAVLGEVIPGKVGTLRSPFTGKEFTVQYDEWQEGAEITCPGTRSRIRLPSDLPPWIPMAEVVSGQPGHVINPHTKKSVPIMPQDWNAGQPLVCADTGQQYLLPPSLPPLEAIVDADQLGKIRSPYTEPSAQAAIIDVSLEDWIPGKLLKCTVTGKDLILPAALPEWLAVGTFVERQPGKVHSPYAEKALVEVSAKDWHAGAKLLCPVTQRHFKLPEHPRLPSLEEEKRILEFAYADPPSDAKKAAQQLSSKGNKISAELVHSVWQRHQLETVEKRRTSLETAEVIPAQPGYVRSPYGNQPTIKIPASLWIQSDASFVCSETGRRFLLPADLPPLQALIVPDQPGKVISPFAEDQGAFELSPEDWLANHSIICPHSQQPLRLPPDLPKWLPKASLIDQTPGVVQSPFLDRKQIHLSGSDWKPGNVLRCPQSGREYQLPDQLPPLIGLHPQEGSIESPYLPGMRFPVSANDWKPGHRVICPATRLPVQLPDQLPEMKWQGKVLQPGLVRSPYGKTPSVQVPPAQWEAGQEITCPETQRRFLLPDPLPPLNAILSQDQMGLVYSPYAPDQEVQIAIEHWEPGKILPCPSTNRPIQLPAQLKAWMGDAKLVANKPGWVISPYHAETEIAVPPEQWITGQILVCPKTQRQFQLPQQLPPLTAILVHGERGMVQSPYVSDEAPQTVPVDQWKAGQHILCHRTQQEFILPAELPQLALEAILIPHQPGLIRSPYDAKSEISVSGSDWKPGHRVVCPSTQHLCLLPESLPPMIATLVEGEPGKVLSPYASQRKVSISQADWMTGKIVTCPETQRPMQLPKDLPAWKSSRPPWIFIVLGGIVIFILALLTSYWFIPSDEEPTPEPVEVTTPTTSCAELNKTGTIAST